jgi:hypothetical protein
LLLGVMFCCTALFCCVKAVKVFSQNKTDRQLIYVMIVLFVSEDFVLAS